MNLGGYSTYIVYRMWKLSERVVIHEGNGQPDTLSEERFHDVRRTRRSGQARQAFQQNRVLVDTPDFREAAHCVDVGFDRASLRSAFL